LCVCACVSQSLCNAVKNNNRFTATALSAPGRQ
jgi:hypothetical protein